MDKKSLSERDICTKFITPALRQAGWDEMAQIREEVSFTKGRIIVRGKLVSRGKGKRADYILYYRPNIPIALIEAKDNTHAIGDGMQQGLDYAETLNILCLLFIHPPAHGSEVSPAARNTLDSARIPRASKLLICGLFLKGEFWHRTTSAPAPSTA